MPPALIKNPRSILAFTERRSADSFGQWLRSGSRDHVVSVRCIQTASGLEFQVYTKLPETDLIAEFDAWLAAGPRTRSCKNGALRTVPAKGKNIRTATLPAPRSLKPKPTVFQRLQQGELSPFEQVVYRSLCARHTPQQVLVRE